MNSGAGAGNDGEADQGAGAKPAAPPTDGERQTQRTVRALRQLEESNDPPLTGQNAHSE